MSDTDNTPTAYDVNVLVHLNIRTRAVGHTEDEAADAAEANVEALLADLDLADYVAAAEVTGLEPVHRHPRD